MIAIVAAVRTVSKMTDAPTAVGGVNQMGIPIQIGIKARSVIRGCPGESIKGYHPGTRH